PTGKPMLKIDNLHATVRGTQILNGLTLEIGAGEIHAIMGPNGAGKSTLAYVLGGRPGYEVTGGSVTITLPVRPEPVEGPPFSSSAGAEENSGASTSSARTVDLLSLEPHERAALGFFQGFQYPVQIPGVRFVQFLREALNAQRKAQGE